MTDSIPITYPTVAAAEKAITDSGYVRDTQRHIWVNPSTQRTAKVVRIGEKENTQFSVQWG